MPSLFPSLRGRARGEAFNKMNRDTALVVTIGYDNFVSIIYCKMFIYKCLVSVCILFC